MIKHLANLVTGSEPVTTEEISVHFPVTPPKDVPAVPREFLYPLIMGVTGLAFILLITSKFFVSLILLAILAAIVFFGYRYFAKGVGQDQQEINDSFFLPFQNALSEEGIYLSRMKIAYLWNYNSVFVFPTVRNPAMKISLANNWNAQALVSIKKNVKLTDIVEN